MNTSIGVAVEEKLVHQINDKKYSELNANLQHFISLLFPFLDKDKKIKCYKTEDFIKPDICISQEEDRRFISVKFGSSETLHTENIISFVNFLKDNGIDDYTIETYLLYHYGDGTTNGTGENRMSSVETRFRMDERIRRMNQVLNSSKAFVKAFADRVMWKGVNPQAEQAEYLYHGDEDFGLFITRKQMLRHIDTKTWDYMDSCVHVGPFVLRPKARYSNKTIINEENRRLVVVTYPRLLSDVGYISRRYNY